MKFLPVAAIALALPGSDAIMVKPEVVVAGCNDQFIKVGNYFSGAYFRGPKGMAFCARNGGMNFMVNGVCTSEAISCARRSPSKVGNPLASPTKLAEIETAAGTYAAKVQRAKRSDGRQQMPPPTLKNLVLMIKYNDTDMSDLSPYSEYEELFNSMSGPNGNSVITESVRSYYKHVSSGRLDINNVLTNWVDIPMTERYVAGECVESEDPNDRDGLDCGVNGHVGDAIISGLLKLDAERPEFFKQFDQDKDGYVDMFTVMHSGFGGESTGQDGVLKYSVWSHKYYLNVTRATLTACGYYDDPPADVDAVLDCTAVRLPNSGLKFSPYNINPGRWFEGDYDTIEPGVRLPHLGVFVHEMGHFLGLPDYYDTDYSSDGLGPYCLMANSWGKDGSQNYPGSMSAQAKYFLGWVDPIELPVGAVNVTQLIQLSAVQDTPTVAKITFSEEEYYLIENRKPVGVDSLLEGGALVFHVDMNVYGNSDELNPKNQSSWATVHPQVRLVQPDGKFDLESNVPRYRGDAGDWFPFINNETGLPAELSDNLLPMPNLNEYKYLGRASQMSISGFTLSDSKIKFTYKVERPTPAPTPAPTQAPTTPAPESPALATWVIPSVAGVAVAAVLVFVAKAATRSSSKESSAASESVVASRNPKFDRDTNPAY